MFRVNKAEAKGGAGITQFGRALGELNIEIICANSSQAKGRVERANRTLQDRLVKELRLENVCDVEAGNAFLPGFMNRFNERFALQPTAPADLHRRLSLPASRINDILCHREQRHVGEQLTVAYDRKQLILERSVMSEELGGKYADLYHFADGRLEVRFKGAVLSYRVFDKEQRVSPAAVVENKRLGHALSRIKTHAKSPKAAISHIPTARRRAIYNDKTALQIKRQDRFAATQRELYSHCLVSARMSLLVNAQAAPFQPYCFRDSASSSSSAGSSSTVRTEPNT